jgi:predicted Zn-dependent protease
MLPKWLHGRTIKLEQTTTGGVILVGSEDSIPFQFLAHKHMKRIQVSLLLIAALACSIIIPPSAQAQSPEPIAPTAGSTDTGKTKLRHGDVQNIGNRDVSGRIYGVLPNEFSLEKEIALGLQMATEFEQTVQLVEDSVITEYIARLGQNLVRHSDSKIPFHIKVLNAIDANAFGLPGGFLYVNNGLILEAESESELAGVMAHAIAHVCARHATRLLSMKQYLQIAASPAIPPVGAPTQAAIQSKLGLGIDLELLGKNREFEMEADQLGIQYLWNTGYDPNAFVTFLEKMQVREKGNPGRPAAFFRTHPSTADRIAQCQEEQRALPKKDLYITGSPEFDRVKTRLLAAR